MPNAAPIPTMPLPTGGPEENKGTLGSSTLILISSIFGSSVLAVPFALAQCGWALGAACLVACALLTQAGACMLVECARRVTLEERKTSVSVTMTQLAVRATPWLKNVPEVGKRRSPPLPKRMRTTDSPPTDPRALTPP